MTLADGQVTTFDKVGSFSLPEESSTWLAYYKGTGGGGGGGRGGAGGRGGRGGGGGAAPAAPRRRRRERRPDAARQRAREAQGARLGSDPPQPRDRRRDHDPRGHRVRVEQEGRLARLRGLVDRRGEGRRVRAPASRDGAVKTLHSGTRPLQEPHVRRGRHAARVPQRPGGVRRSRSRRIASITGRAGDAAGDRDRLGHDRRHAEGHGRRRDRRAALLDATARASSSATAPPPAAAAPIRTPRRPSRSRSTSGRYKDPLIQPMQQVRAEQERERSYRAVVHLADKKFVQLATPDLPTVNAGDDPRAAIGTSDLPYRQEISWDQTYNDVYLLDLKTGKPKKVLEHWGNAGTTLSPGGKYVLHFDEKTGHWFTLPRRRRRAREPHREARRCGSSRRTTRRICPGAVRHRRLDGRRRVGPALRQVRHLGSEAGRHRRAQGHRRRGTQAGRHLPLSLARSRTNGPSRRTSRCCCRRPTIARARPASTASPSLTATAAPEKVVMLDKAFGAVTKAKNADTVVFTLSRFEEFPDLWVSDTDLQGHEEGVERQPAAGAVRLGQVGADRVHQRRRQEAARDPDQAGELRSDEEVPADGLHLRGADAGAAQLRRAERRHQHQHPALRQQRLRRAAARHRLHDRLPG